MENNSAGSSAADAARGSDKPSLVSIHSCPSTIQNTEPAKANFLRAAMEKREFICTAELVLGRDHNVNEAEAFIKEAAQQTDGIKVISLTDLPGGNPALPPEAFVSYVLEHGLTPIAHLTGKDGNRSFLEARLHELARLGVENVLALTGDAQKEGFSGRSKPVYDLDSVLILWLIHALRSGLEYKQGIRTAHTTPFNFFTGAVVNPFKVREPDLLMQFYKLQLKVAAGAQYIITQLGYNLRKLVELKQFMIREGIGQVPVLANVYVPTAKIAQMMQAGEVAGCVITDEFIKRLEGEKKPQRLERAALMVAAVKDLGFAGAHIGGFGLTYKDFATIRERASAIGKDWRGRMDELVFAVPDEFYLLPENGDGLSDGEASYQIARLQPHASFAQRLSESVHKHFIRDGSFGARFFGPRMKKNGEPEKNNSWRHGLWYKLLSLPRSIARPPSAASAAEIACRTISTTPAAPCAGATKNCAMALAAAREWMEPARLVPICRASGTWFTWAPRRWAMIPKSSLTCSSRRAIGAWIAPTH